MKTHEVVINGVAKDVCYASDMEALEEKLAIAVTTILNDAKAVKDMFDNGHDSDFYDYELWFDDLEVALNEITGKSYEDLMREAL